MEEMTRNELEASRSKKSAAEEEKKQAKDKCLEAYKQADKHLKDAEEAKKQLHKVEVCEGAWLKFNCIHDLQLLLTINLFRTSALVSKKKYLILRRKSIVSRIDVLTSRLPK